MINRILSTIAAAGLTLAVASHSLAETTGEDAAKYRMAVMTSLGGHIGAISMMVRGLVQERGFLVKHAQGLANGAAELDHLFPEGSNVEDSEALPEIWAEPEKFAAAKTEAQKATATFAEVAARGDMKATGGALRDVGKACKGCHEQFRVEHDND